jgi:hypothetical protein
MLYSRVLELLAAVVAILSYVYEMKLDCDEGEDLSKLYFS